MTFCLSRGSKLAKGFREQKFAEVGEALEMSHKADFLMLEVKKSQMN